MTTEQNPKKAIWLSLIPGLGQIYNKQKTKGYIFLAVTILFLAYFLGIGAGELAKLVTLGTVRGQDNSLFILIRGAFHLIITVVYFLFYALNIKDAGTVAKRINNGIAVPKTLKDMVHAIYENGFPYLLIIPSYIAMTFAIIFPVLVTLMIAFTNYTSATTGDATTGFTITNTNTEKVNVPVTKKWVGPKAGPVTVHLLADGTDTGKTTTLSDANSWTDTFSGLDRYKTDGTEIVYSVKEDEVSGYTSEITGDATTGFYDEGIFHHQ